MDFIIKLSAISILVILTGLSAGLCFTWSNAVTPGIGRLEDFEFLSSFQQMNRAILNPLFYIVFLGPLFAGLFNLYAFKESSPQIIWLLIGSIIIYFIGVLLVTIFGNVPLNDMLDKVNLNLASTESLLLLRRRFEVKWNHFHLIRTISALVSFITLIWNLTQISKNHF